MTVGLLVAAGSLKHFFPQKKKKSRRRETENQTLGTRNNLGLFLSVNAVVSSDQLAERGGHLCVYWRSPLQNWKFMSFNDNFTFPFFFLWSKPLKIDQKKKNFPFAPFKRRPVKGQHFDSIGWGTDKSSHCWNQTKTSDCYWHFNASLIIRQSIRNENGASAWFAMKFGPLVMTSWPNRIQMISKWIWRLLKLSVHLKIVASFCAE